MSAVKLNKIRTEIYQATNPLIRVYSIEHGTLKLGMTVRTIHGTVIGTVEKILNGYPTYEYVSLATDGSRVAIAICTTLENDDSELFCS
jgi:translation initiation factor IF-2